MSVTDWIHCAQKGAATHEPKSMQYFECHLTFDYVVMTSDDISKAKI